jgi:hypothetical protein
MDAQYYMKDSLIGAPDVPQKMLMNAFANILYTNGNFSAGVRYESYQDVLQGYDSRNVGNGIPYKFISYKSDELEVTVGNFYEQFGNGLVLRLYQDWSLGVDNSVEGVKVVYKPFKGVTIKALAGTQRFFFEQGPGIVRAADGEFYLNDIFKGLENKKTKITVGGSVVSKYQDKSDPVYNLPANVAAFDGRANIVCGKINFVSEYAYKVNDPSLLNNYIYKPGDALYTSATFSQKGLGISVSADRIDNMGFQSDRTATGNVLYINYLPSLPTEHTYQLEAMYPYATQPNGEMGEQGTISYNIKRNTALGGRYGTDVTVNYSRVSSIDMEAVNDTTPIGENGTLGYKSDFSKFGKELYYDDFNVEIDHKFSQRFKADLSYMYQTYNKEIIQGHPPTIYAHIGVLDLTYKLKEKKSFQLELQHLYTREENGSWAMAMLQYTIAPKWFFAVSDMYNYGNSDDVMRINYYNATFGFIKNTNRIAIGWGKQRAGIFCVGGVCRYVPASNGFSLSIMSSF